MSIGNGYAAKAEDDTALQPGTTEDGTKLLLVVYFFTHEIVLLCLFTRCDHNARVFRSRRFTS